MALQQRILLSRFIEIIRAYWYLGFTSFGGPGVHVIILRSIFVKKLQWVDESTFTDLFALGNALPGPGSTQLAFSIALVRAGLLPGLLAFFIWSLPGSIGMTLLAIGVRHLPSTLPPIALSILTGINSAALGLIALAAVTLSMSSITDEVSRAVLMAAAAVGVCYQSPWLYPVLTVSGGIVTFLYDLSAPVVLARIKERRLSQARKNEGLDHNDQVDAIELASRTPAESQLAEDDSKSIASPVSSSQQASSSLHRRLAVPSSSLVPQEDTQQPTQILHLPSTLTCIVLFVSFVGLLVGLLVARAVVTKSHGGDPARDRELQLVSNMMIAGTIIFGGGPVVIPLLRGYTVDPGWVSSRDFLLAFALLQAWPGPNFAFAACLGALSLPHNPVLGAFLGFVGIFSPGIILKMCLLPLYAKFRTYEWARSVLRGLNASASGLVYVAVFRLWRVGSFAQGGTVPISLENDGFWAATAGAAFVASRFWTVPPWAVIAGGALGGVLRWAAIGRFGR